MGLQALLYCARIKVSYAGKFEFGFQDNYWELGARVDTLMDLQTWKWY